MEWNVFKQNKMQKIACYTHLSSALVFIIRLRVEACSTDPTPGQA